ncbi:MAG: NfeD family protein [Microcystaceae cyanobacterium]
MFVNPVMFWLIVGACLCLMEAVLPTAFVALMMGISAIAVALLANWITGFSVQGILWLSLSTLLIVASRRLVPKAIAQRKIRDAVEAETLTAIAPGETGRVLYEGNSWPAQCGDPELSLEAHQKVYIAHRKGNLLIVYPANHLE